MIVSCPSCQTRYKVDTNAISRNGRTVRCVKCQHTWVQNRPPVEEVPAHDDDDFEGPVVTDEVEDTLPDDAPDGDFDDLGPDIDDDFDDELGEDVDLGDAPVDLADFEPQQIDRSTGRAVRQQKSVIGAVIGWTLLAAIVFGGLGSSIYYRDILLEKWPKSNRLYSLIGLGIEVPGAGLEIQNVMPERHREDDVMSLVIKGDVINTSQKVRNVPRFRGALNDSEGNEVHSWIFTIRQEILLPRESVPFISKVESPPKGASDLSITFLAHEEEAQEEMMDEAQEEATMDEAQDEATMEEAQEAEEMAEPQGEEMPAEMGDEMPAEMPAEEMPAEPTDDTDSVPGPIPDAPEMKEAPSDEMNGAAETQPH